MAESVEVPVVASKYGKALMAESVEVPVVASKYGKALMAESVDALVSNTSGAIRAGSTPAQGTRTEILRRGFPFYRIDAPGLSMKDTSGAIRAGSTPAQGTNAGNV